MKRFILTTNKILLLLGFITASGSIWAQDSQITADVSQLYTSFNFTDSEGNELNKEYEGIFTNAYSIGYTYVAASHVFVEGNIGMRKAGATLVYDNVNYMWDLQYADVKLGVGYIYTKKFIKPYISAAGYYGFLLKANQSLNNQNFDMLETNSIEDQDFGIMVSPGARIELSRTVSFYTEFNYLRGLKNLETDDSGQKSYNKAFGLTAGLSINLFDNFAF